MHAIQLTISDTSSSVIAVMAGRITGPLRASGSTADADWPKNRIGLLNVNPSTPFRIWLFYSLQFTEDGETFATQAKQCSRLLTHVSKETLITR